MGQLVTLKICPVCNREEYRGYAVNVAAGTNLLQCDYCGGHTRNAMTATLNEGDYCCRKCGDALASKGQTVRTEPTGQNDGERCKVCQYWRTIKRVVSTTPTHTDEESMNYQLSFSIRTVKNIDGHRGQIVATTPTLQLNEENETETIVWETEGCYESSKEAAQEAVAHLGALIG
jgi:hypothetical protein